MSVVRLGHIMKSSEMGVLSITVGAPMRTVPVVSIQVGGNTCANQKFATKIYAFPIYFFLEQIVRLPDSVRAAAAV